MRATLISTLILAGLAAPAHAGNDGVDLSLRFKAMAAAASAPASTVEAPFRASHDPLPELLLREEQQQHHGFQSNCETASTALCYDPSEKHIVYRAARDYMPKLEGLRPESLSVRRDRLVLRYSF